MITPTPAEIQVLRAAANKRHGSARMLLVRLEHPIGAALVMAALDLKSYGRHVDARQGGQTGPAASAIVVDQLLWCSPRPIDIAALPADKLTPTPELVDPLAPVMLDRLEALREAWPATDGKVDLELRLAAGGNLTAEAVVRLTPGNAPEGFARDRVPLAASSIRSTGPGALWLASWVGPTERVDIVMRAPLPDVWSAAFALFNTAVAKGEGLVPASMRFAAEHVVWSAEPFPQLVERLPALGLIIKDAFLAMGGHEAESSATFL